MIGAVLAGGIGRRIGGDKALVELEHRPLISYPLEVLREVLGDVAVVAKADTRLPVLHETPVWIEPDEPRHPLAGVVHALRRAAGRPVLACPADMPLLTSDLVRALMDAEGAPAVVARGQPLLGRFDPPVLAALEALGFERPARELVREIGAVELEWEDLDALLNVNSPEDVLAAASALRRRA